MTVGIQLFVNNLIHVSPLIYSYIFVWKSCLRPLKKTFQRQLVSRLENVPLVTDNMQ